MARAAKKQTAKSAVKNKPKIVAVSDLTPSAQTNASLVARRDAAVPRGVASAAPI